MWKSVTFCLRVTTKKLWPQPRPTMLASLCRTSPQRRNAVMNLSVRFCNSMANEGDAVLPTEEQKVQLDNTSLDDFYYNSVLNSRYILLGKSVLQCCLIEHLLNLYESLDASQIADLAAYFTKEILPLSDHYISAENVNLSQKRAKMYEELGMLYEANGQFAVFQYVKGLTSYQLSKQDIDIYSKLAHPRATLDAIMHLKGLPLEVRRTGKKSVAIYVDDKFVQESTASSVEKAEYEACLSYIRDNHLNEVKDITLDPKRKIIKKKFKGKFTGQRVIELSKEPDEHYGLYLKGGEKDTIETEKFLRYNYITPIYISSIQPGSPAEKSGLLQKGDIILAAGDFTFSGLTIESAIELINRENTLTLTVRHDPNIKLRERIVADFRKRENKSFKDTLKIDNWRKWHEATAENEPGKYIDKK